MSRAGPVRLEELLAHRDWVSRLARYMAGPASEDVTQDAWVAALRSPPEGDRPPRAWLAHVVRNLVRLRWRDDSRRARREQVFVAQGPNQAEAIDQAYERLELERYLAEQVMALEAPLREVVVLRYVEGLDSTQIGELVGAPAGTVRWRLKQALDRLRDLMDSHCGDDRRRWAVLLAPPALVQTPGILAGAFLMANTKLKLSLVASMLVALLLGLSGLVWWRSRPATDADANATLLARQGPPSSAGARLRLDPNVAIPITATSATLEGLVRDSEGNPVKGATVIAAAAPLEGTPTQALPPPAAPARSAADGSFQLTIAGPGSYIVTATKPEVGTARSASVTVPRGRRVRGIVLTLDRARAGLSGRVIDSGGGGIPGARVLATLATSGGSITFAAIADDQGHYNLPLGTGSHDFEARADGYATARFWMYLHLPMVREFRLHPASRITGRVVNGDGRDPLPGAEVWANAQQMTGRQLQTTAGPDGSFAFSDLEPGTYLLAGRSGPFIGRRPGQLNLTLAQVVSDVELQLSRGRTVTGTVHTREGAPAPDVPVTLAAGAFLAVRTNARGEFEIPGLPSNTFELRASAPQGSARERVNLTAGDVRVRLVLAPDAALTGVVLDQRRRPVPEARVVAAIGTVPNRRNTIGFSDQAGRFRIEGLGAGPLSVSAVHDLGLTEVEAGTLETGDRKHVELILGQGASVTGTVRTESGRPAAGVQVFAITASAYTASPWPTPTAGAQTAADGSYRLGGLPAGEIVIRAANPGDDPFTVMMGRTRRPDNVAVALRPTENKAGVDLVVLKNDLTIRGRVADAEGRPVAGAVLQAIADGAGAPGARTRTLSQQDGQFVIDGLTGGPHTILVVHPDFADFLRDSIAAGATGVELRLQRPGSLGGTVVREGDRPVTEFMIVGRPVLGAEPSESELRGHWQRPAIRARVSNARGIFLFEKIPPGTYELNAFLPDKTSASLAPVSVGPGENKTGVRLQAQPSATIRGRIVDYRTGQPVPGARAEGRGNAGGQLTATADASGMFALEGLPAGRLIDFAVTPPRGDYITDCQHRVMPARGGVVEIGDVPLFPGNNQRLGVHGAATTGIWFQSQEGRPAIYSLVPGSPGASAGARVGEFVLAVDDTDVRKTSSSVVEGLVASSGQSVKLTLQAGTAPPRIITVVRPAAAAIARSP
jgi:RNA polymerase sigma factor (sigma-70 family)